MEIIDAIDGTALTEQEISQLVYKGELGYLTKSEIGCALSHQKIYKKMLEENIQAALILEDDAIFCNDINVKELIHKIYKIIKKKKIILLLQKGLRVYINRSIKINEQYHAYEANTAWTSHGYLITQQAAKTLLRINTPLTMAADAWRTFYKLSCLKIYSLNKDIIATRDLDKIQSSIEKERSKKTDLQISKK